MYPSSKENNHRHPNKDVGMEKLPEINKRRAYFYSELKSTLLIYFVYQERRHLVVAKYMAWQLFMKYLKKISN